jgi:hypothetical protein
MGGDRMQKLIYDLFQLAFVIRYNYGSILNNQRPLNREEVLLACGKLRRLLDEIEKKTKELPEVYDKT